MRKSKFTKKTLLNIINNTDINDIHTHLFPWGCEDYFLSGLEELLNYHYFTAEFLSASEMNPNKFFSLTKSKRAELIWNFLFLDRTPISETSRGLVKIFQFLNIKNYENQKYSQVLKKFKSKKYEYKDILKKLKIKKIVMTNNPFDRNEWAIFKKKNLQRNIFSSSIRLDDLFKSEKKFTEKKLRVFMTNAIKISNPIYFAISVDGRNIKKIFNSKYMKNVIFPMLEKKNIPIMILIGVKRNVNKNFKDSGDGIGNEDCSYLESIVRKNQKIKFLVTHLSDLCQYKLIVLSRKFSNLKLFGFWWFLNQRKMVSNILDQKINLLGFNFIAQHSDARVFEQLIYKWTTFKEILTDVLYEKYNSLEKDGLNISEKKVKRDINKILNPDLNNL